MLAIIVSLLMLFITSCVTWNIDPQTGELNPQMNNDDFINYTPWWATNATNATNSVSDINTNNVKGE